MAHRSQWNRSPQGASDSRGLSRYAAPLSRERVPDISAVVPAFVVVLRTA